MFIVLPQLANRSSLLNTVLRTFSRIQLSLCQPPHEIIVKFSGRLPLRFSNISDMLIFPDDKPIKSFPT